MFERDEENPIPFVTIRQVDWQMLGKIKSVEVNYVLKKKLKAF